MIEVNFDLEKAVNGAVADLNKSEVDFRLRMKKALAESGAYMLKSIDTNFRVGGRPKWPALSKATITNRMFSKKQKSKGAAAILQDTGRLKNSMVYKVEGDSVKIGTNVEYAAVHQFGHKGIRLPDIYPKRKKVLSWVNPQTGARVFRKMVRAHTVVIPQRAFLLFQDKDIAVIEKIFVEHIGKAFGGPGFRGADAGTGGDA